MDLLESHNKTEMESEKTMNSNKAEQQQREDLSPNKGSENNNRLSPAPMPPAVAQLTIFYNGSVSVYDTVTPEKAQAIMLVAAAASTAAAAANKVPQAVAPKAGGPGTVAAAATAPRRSLSQQSSSGAAAAAGSPVQTQVLASPNASSLCCKLPADLPIARRHSLQQFLEKRRSRLVSKAPYAPAKKPEESIMVGVEGKPQPAEKAGPMLHRSPEKSDIRWET